MTTQTYRFNEYIKMTCYLKKILISAQFIISADIGLYNIKIHDEKSRIFRYLFGIQ